ALGLLVRIHVSLHYSIYSVVNLFAVYLLAALPFFAGGAVLSLAFSRLTGRINMLYGADLLGAAAGCLALVPLLNLLGAPGVVVAAATLSAAAAICLAPAPWRRRVVYAATVLVAVPALLQSTELAPFDVMYAKGYENARMLFGKWNSFSRVAVYSHPH